jgi:hypothetical protein
MNDFSALTDEEKEEHLENGGFKDSPERPSDQELEDKRQAELAAEREEHLRRTNGG